MTPDEDDRDRPEPLYHTDVEDVWSIGGCGDCLDTDDHFDENPE